MKEMIKLGLILLTISLVAALALAVTNGVTKDLIQEQKDAKNELARKDVLPAATSFEVLTPEELQVIIANFPLVADAFVGKADGAIVGYVVRTLPSGYSGAVEVVTGVDATGSITGVRIGKHNETPGLGAKARLPEFYSQYDGKVASTLMVNKTKSSETEIQAIAGATITSQAVTDGVNIAGQVAALLTGK